MNQSFNGQVADVHKDLCNYADATGRDFCQCSKYVARMAEAADRILDQGSGTFAC
ncbi:hypothetical protein [Streptomyces sp. NPDC092307]|uniref:hypothetical protein n=1 Tax=Streptomyces sp. NPDC092307 TaxID=3366013 RepID=UPI003826EC49